MSTGLKIFVRLTGVFTALLGFCLFYASLSPLLIAWMYFTGNGPGGQSPVYSADIWSGILYSLVATVTVALGVQNPRPNVCGIYGDRKSTRLNSSHRCISYAVFCLKKKKKNKIRASTHIH